MICDECETVAHCMKNGCVPKTNVQQEPEFFTHNVEQPYDWSEWVCPDPKGYLMKCCDCGLVHEAEFGVVRYKSETEREDCEPVNDPNLQAVFRMRRSEQWSPEDTAHRAGGLPMEQPAQQEPVAWIQIITWRWNNNAGTWEGLTNTSPPAQRKPLTDEQIMAIGKELGLKCRLGGNPNIDFDYARAIEAAHGIKENT